MTKDIFEEFAEEPIPQIPKSMDCEIHAQLNRSVTFGALIEFMVRTIPFVAFLFTRAIFGLIIYTISGSYHLPKNQNDPTDEIR